MIYALDRGDGVLEYVISSRQVWRPGCYDSARAARYAFRFRDADLQALQDSVNPGGIITFTMLQELRKRRQVENGARCRRAGCPTPAISGRYDADRKVYSYSHGDGVLELGGGSSLSAVLERRAATLRWYAAMHK